MVQRSVAWLREVPLFRNFLAANTLSLLGSNIFDISIPLYVWERTHSPVALSLVGVALTIPYLIMAPITGYAVDHFDNRKIMILADVGQVFTLLGLLALEYFNLDTMFPLLFCVFTIKTLYILFETVGSFHLIPAIVPRDALQTANTWFLSSNRLIQVLGPFLGGVLMSIWGFRVCAAVNLLSFFTTLYFTVRMKNLSAIIHRDSPMTHKGRFNPKAVYRSFAESIHYIWRSPLFRPFIFAMFWWNLTSLTPTAPSMTYFFRGMSGYTDAQFGSVVSLCGLVGIIGFFASGRLYKTMSFRQAFVGSCWWQAIFSTLALAFIQFPSLFALTFAVSRAGSSILAMGTFFIRQTEVPRARVGAVNASIRMHFMVAAPFSALLQGYIIKHFGAMTSLILGAGCLWGTLWYSSKVAHAYDQRPQESPLAA